MRSAARAVLGQRIVRHGFADRPASTVAQAAGLTVGVQAQDPQAARLGVRSRAARLTEADVLHAMDVERSVVRTSLMRATIHLVDADDVAWLTALIGPAIARKFQKRWRDLGLSAGLLAGAMDVLPDALAGGPHTRAEIMTALADSGIVIDLTDQAPTHVLLHATAAGLVCRGPDRGRDATFVLLDDWLPRAPAGPRDDDTLAELARRFFLAFSPATAADFTTWSGLPAGRAVALIRDELTAVDVVGRPGFTLGDVEPQHGLRLLSAFDNYLVGYRERDVIIDAAHRPHVYLGGMIRPAVLLDGRIVGTWRLMRTPAEATVEVTPLRALANRVRAAIEAEAADIGRFIDLPTALAFTPPPS
ncbi:MAG: winged helix DNA-binding domain-containing protein [Pseudonocardiales bacterium]|nr:MAG: winged helix DNA-binding domain-containing protein [Pseudonocardiales bacterium]